MSAEPRPVDLLPFPLPLARQDRALLIMIRRMAHHGIRDAGAAMVALDMFSVHFRRPLVLLRSLIMELAEVSRQKIKIAPCCAPRMTRDEALLLGCLAAAGDDRGGSAATLQSLVGATDTASPQSLAQALNATMTELGLPIGA